MPIVGWKSEGVDCSRDQFLLGWCPLFFSLEWWGNTWHRVYSSLAVRRWRELFMSRILGHNQGLPLSRQFENVLLIGGGMGTRM
jgi:hypothetical protein